MSTAELLVADADYSHTSEETEDDMIAAQLAKRKRVNTIKAEKLS